MAVFKGTIQEIEDYFLSENLSQSLIKNPRGKIRDNTSELYYEEKKHFILGNLADTFIFTPERFEHYYYIDNLQSKPSSKVISILKQLYDSIIGEINDLGAYLSSLQTICNEQEYNLPRAKENVSEDTRIRDIVNSSSEYWNNLIKAKDKQVISLEEYNEAFIACEQIKLNQNTNFIVNYKEELDYYIQTPLYFEDLKALPDIFIVNNNEYEVWLTDKLAIGAKQIFLIDLKTTSKYLDNIEELILFRRYDIQLDFYKYIISQVFQNFNIETFLVINSLKEPQYPELVYVNTDEVNYNAKTESWQSMLARTKEILNSNYVHPEIRDIGFRKANLNLYV